MYKAPDCYQKLLHDLQKNEAIGSHVATLIYVESGLFLLEYLELNDEPITALWAILSGISMPHPAFEKLMREPRWQRAIANARILIPFSARSAWLQALKTYISEIPPEERDCCYRLTEEDFEKLDDELLEGQWRPKAERHVERTRVYRQCLEAELKFETRKVECAKAGTWFFRAETEEETIYSNVVLTEEHAALAPTQEGTWLKSERTRLPFCLDMKELRQTAEFLNRREATLHSSLVAQDNGVPDSVIGGNWVQRWEQIKLYPVVGQDLGSRTERLEIDGWAHIAGMVASGKSTLVILLAASVIRANLKQSESSRDIWPPQRLTLVVPDVDTALRLANQLNWWFRDSPESDEPVAVPLLGRTSRHKHRQMLYNSAAYRNAIKQGQPHWAERWLSSVCPLQGALSDSERERLNHHPLKPGSEPCTRLSKDARKLSNAHLCPFFTRCPAQQAYFDMPAASIWITTPGAMAVASLPKQLNDWSQARLGELIYEQSDMVIVDEADTVMEWFDGVYAEEVALTNGRDAVLNKLDTQTTSHRLFRSRHDGWMKAVHESSVNAAKILMQMSAQSDRHNALEPWSQGASFTPYALFYHLAQCLVVGQIESKYDREEPDADRQARTERTRMVMDWFWQFLEDKPFEDTPLPGYARRRVSRPEIVADLPTFCGAIRDDGDSTSSKELHKSCKNWIGRAYRAAQEWHSPEGQPVPELVEEVADALAYRLQFALTVRLLDWYSRTVFVEWYRKPTDMEAEQPHRRIPRGLLDILPLPPEGRQYGAFLTSQPRYSPEKTGRRKRASTRPPSLSMFAYTNMGRAYLLNFHRLHQALKGTKGPNVLALSGTSYLPDSTRFHIGAPQAVLQSEDESLDAIARSTFAFVPRHNKNKAPLIVSGVDDKEGALQQLVQALCGVTGSGNVLEEYVWLQSHQGDAGWNDRSRILMFVNSYEQAAATRVALERSLHGSELSLGVRALQRAEEGDVYEDERHIKRADVENFAFTGGKILIAPLSAVGRGVNILNENGKAAFGAVYFLVRPMPHPADATAIAQEVNRRTLDWAQDPDFDAWKMDGIEKCARELRNCAGELWRSAERRTSYRSLHPHAKLGFNPRHDLAATTAGLVIQAVGRLVRGGVPFRAYFADAAWAPNSAQMPPQLDTEDTSLLVALRERLQNYVDDDAIGKALYESLTKAMQKIENLHT